MRNLKYSLPGEDRTPRGGSRPGPGRGVHGAAAPRETKIQMVARRQPPTPGCRRPAVGTTSRAIDIGVWSFVPSPSRHRRGWRIVFQPPSRVHDGTTKASQSSTSAQELGRMAQYTSTQTATVMPAHANGECKPPPSSCTLGCFSRSPAHDCIVRSAALHADKGPTP